MACALIWLSFSITSILSSSASLGGCYVEGQESPENAFHWEKTIGPIEERPGHKNVNWRYRTSDGMGFDEYLQLA